jgi:hypothetical protein
VNNNFVACLALAVVVSSVAVAEEAPTKVGTKLEAFSARSGSVTVKGYTGVGRVESGATGGVEVTALEFRDAANPKVREYGVTISVSSGRDRDAPSTSYIDADEIDSLLHGVDYLMRADKSVTSLADFEVRYRTRGDLRLVVFSSSAGKISAAVESGTIGRARAFVSVAQLGELMGLLTKAQGVIASAKAAK